MSEQDWLAERFESDRARLRAVAHRMLGSQAEAEDAVQETWIRLSRSDTSSVENLSGWLTTVVSRVSLNMLQSRRSRREDLLDAADIVGPGEPGADGPEGEATMADSVGVAMLVVLDRLTPAERLAFVLHDMFAVPFEEIATIVDRSPTAARKLASRARRRIQQAGPDATAGRTDDATTAQTAKAELVRAFLAASRGGDFEPLLATLDPDIVVRADEMTVRLSAQAAVRGAGLLAVEPEMRGADAVTRAFAGLSWAPRLALIDGTAGLVWAPNGEPRVAFRFTVAGNKITAIDIQADLTGLAVALC
ncbi:sigma-70 family RNA polymerase sigma factor [Actinomadura sp. NAK00032]|uniref:sigma-70 family RNA polymerase sigma factor n=1 Tax=Actinomadura sp. NAK00032 TaxID=2742128 RepID=UPI0015917396|nr:sigma-70 family RNA polymerase sigma factor [Actinomadura sp. NAK00032]QKW39682.1 sigma-70 family RNA polymerase sigma factor [Actinomadura sp. NAK00032]